jgi:hypothetical protein
MKINFDLVVSLQSSVASEPSITGTTLRLQTTKAWLTTED